MRLLVVLFLIMLIMGCVQEGKEAKVEEIKSLQGKKILMVIAPKNFRDEELSIPKQYFESIGATVRVASVSKNEATGMLGARVKPDLALSEVDIKKYDALVIVGGVGSKEYLWSNDELLTLVKEAYDNNKIVAAICLSPVVLARAGILKGKEATVFPSNDAVEELKKAGVKYVDKPVVISGKIITARDPKAAKEFAKAIAGEI